MAASSRCVISGSSGFLQVARAESHWLGHTNHGRRSDASPLNQRPQWSYHDWKVATTTTLKRRRLQLQHPLSVGPSVSSDRFTSSRPTRRVGAKPSSPPQPIPWNNCRSPDQTHGKAAKNLRSMVRQWNTCQGAAKTVPCVYRDGGWLLSQPPRPAGRSQGPGTRILTSSLAGPHLPFTTHHCHSPHHSSV